MRKKIGNFMSWQQISPDIGLLDTAPLPTVGSSLLLTGRSRQTERNAKMKWTAGVVALALFMAGCGGNNKQTSSLTGNWQLTAHSTVFGLTVTGSGALSQLGNSVAGQVSLSGTPCATTAAVSGSVSGTTVTLQLQEGSQAVNFTGAANSGFTSISGSYTAPSGGCTNGDSGTWSATKN